MSDYNTSLIDALDFSIKQIKARYLSDWFLTDKGYADIDKIALLPNNFNDLFHMIINLKSHSFLEICIGLSGSFAMQMESRIINVNVGDVCIVRPGIMHRELPKKNCSYESIWIYVLFDKISLHLSGRNSVDGNFHTTDGFIMKSTYDCNFYVSNIKEELENESEYFKETIKSNVLQLLILIVRKIKEENQGKLNHKPWKDYIVLQVQFYVKRNLSNAIRLSDISQEVNVSPNYLNSIFKAETGKTIMQYLEDLKIEEAKRLLKSTDSSINEISQQLGYYDQYHFSKIFKKVTGSSPTKYRKI